MTQPTDAGSGWKNDPKVIEARKKVDWWFNKRAPEAYLMAETDVDALCAAVAASRGGEGTEAHRVLMADVRAILLDRCDEFHDGCAAHTDSLQFCRPCKFLARWDRLARGAEP